MAITIVLAVLSYAVPDLRQLVWACDRGPTRTIRTEDGCTYPGAILIFAPATIWLCGLGWIYHRNLRPGNRSDGDQ